ncbi:MAG: right-handed parallel beta-helix repeat-containing protein [Deltaproteobacteria bacterium]|nr:right-handed parallel beta-helix repeat-containing protein [Deltaproteobacteria bacterium]
MSDARRAHLWSRLLAGGALSVVLAVPVQAATTWYVANNGSDLFSPSCGSKPLPCRSISKAITLAAAGDTILIGPGHYGDLDGSGTFGDFPGEEAAEIGSGCECMIKVDKQLTMLSRDGALVTVLDAGGLTQSVVHIALPSADGTVFGKLNKGFTLRNGAANGLLTDPSTGTSSVQIVGNVAISNPTGFNVGLEGDLTKPTLVDNLAMESSTAGFSLSGNYSGMQRNRAVRNGSGIAIGGDGHNVWQNVAVQNTDGFQVVLSGPGIGRPAASPDPPWPGFKQNAVIANTHAGVNVQALSGTIPGIWMKNSNLYGNGDPAANCGVAVDNEETTNQAIASFYDSYWGSSTGQGPNPADTAGPTCLTGAGTVSPLFVFPDSGFLVKEVVIAEKPLK